MAYRYPICYSIGYNSLRDLTYQLTSALQALSTHYHTCIKSHWELATVKAEGKEKRKQKKTPTKLSSLHPHPPPKMLLKYKTAFYLKLLLKSLIQNQIMFSSLGICHQFYFVSAIFTMFASHARKLSFKYTSISLRYSLPWEEKD